MSQFALTGAADAFPGAGIDTRGDDEIFGLEGNDDVNAGRGADTVHGGASDDVLKGGAGADTLNGDDGADADALWGQNGDDTLYGGAGADAFLGGAGMDTVSYRCAVGDVGVELNGAGGFGEAGAARPSAARATTA